MLLTGTESTTNPATCGSPTARISTNVLTPEQVAFYDQHGWLHIPQMFDRDEIDRMSDDLDWLIEN